MPVSKIALDIEIVRINANFQMQRNAILAMANLMTPSQIFDAGVEAWQDAVLAHNEILRKVITEK